MSKVDRESRADAPVYRLHGPWPDGRPPDAEAVGAKAANLMRMAEAGLPVPPGFVLGTGFCRRFMAEGKAAFAEIPAILKAEVADLERVTGRRFGDGRRPLLLSVRSGAAASMPGMLETILNVGLNETAVNGLFRMTGNPKFAWDCYRRLIQQYGEVVAGLGAEPFERLVAAALDDNRAGSPRDLDFEALEDLSAVLLRHVHARSGRPFPSDPQTQLRRGVEAVIRSWSADKAREYRRINALADDCGTAVTVQAMVFGNSGSDSGTGVGFTRDPATGEKALFFDFLFNGQGEDVVAGRSTAADAVRLEARLPGLDADLRAVGETLEALFGDMQDFEFTVEQGRLFLLQTRSGKRTPLAALAIAADLVAEGAIGPAEAVARVAHIDLDRLERLTCRPGRGVSPLAQATSASVGVAAGVAVFDTTAARRAVKAGKPVVLIRKAASTDDIESLALAEGLLTAGGARTSHAAVVARQLGKVCLVGCRALAVENGAPRCRIGDAVIEEGDPITLDANKGVVYAGSQPIRRERPEAAIAAVDQWRRQAAASSGADAG